ncbi:uncharacterized protein tasor2 isoform X2 [Megalops cyprinoides]|uniref:uncharacterized protein tasor2 isoform X2 n=1 Tax=Megalops cyprinoides TaxID=118141 RepID=UPI0018651867|nr:uncharacterized protein tasor2 isoform X2 [Megalops cyprinoides]
MPFFKRKKGKRLTKEKQFSAMESENAASEAVSLTWLLEPVLPGSGKFQDDILPALQRSYMYSESKTCFRYSSAHLINNAALQKEYQAFRAEKRGRAYTEEELEESFGFLLFDHEGKAKELSERGLVVGHSTCSTLGDPSKGVYISKYSDCLDFNPWYHGKSGYIAILRLTKGRVRTVMENYTRNFTLPSPGFDCHESEQIGAVSSTTSSFLAYERTQYYLYEACGQGEGMVARPRHALPFAIVEFSYGETKPCAEVLQEKSVEKPVVHYYPWRGQLQIQSLIYHVALRSNAGALIPAQLPETLATDHVMQLSDLRKLLPQGFFETCFTGEVSLEGRFYTVFEVVTLVADDASVRVLTQELKEKDLALLVQLNDSGFLVLLHSSCFLTYEGKNIKNPMSERTETLLAMFVFPDSRTVQKATKIMRSSSALSPEVMQILPGLNYAETEVEKCPPDQQEALCELVEQRLQNYAALIQPGMLDSPSREASGFPDQYDMPEVFKHLYSAPKCGEATFRQLQAYLGQPDAYTLPVARAVELLAVGRGENDDDSDVIYCCLSSPEEVPATPASFPGDGNPEESQRQSDGHVEGVGMEGRAVPEGDAEGGAGHHQEGEEEAALPIAASQPPIPEVHGALGTAVLTYAEPSVEVTEATPTPMSGDLPIDLSAVAAGNRAVTSQPGDVPVRETGMEGSAQGGVFTSFTEKAGDSLGAKGRHAAESISLVQTLPGARPPTGPTRRTATRRTRRRKKKISNPAQPKALAKDPRVEEEAAMMQPQTLKRKGFRYGLKTIITDCGRVFIPHGSEILPKDIMSLTEMQTVNSKCLEDVAAEPAGNPSSPVETANRQAVSTEMAKGQAPPMETADKQSPLMETVNRQTPPTDTADRQTTPIETADRQTSPMETADRKETGLSCELLVGTVVSPLVVADQNKDPENKIPPDKTGLEGTAVTKTLISLGELRTILQKGKRRKARSLDDQTFAALKEPPPVNSEPQHKRSKRDACPENDPQKANRNCGSTVSPVGTHLLQSESKLMNILGSDPKLLEKTQRAEGSPKDGTRPRRNSPRRNSPRRADVVKSSPRSDEALKAAAPSTTVAELVKLVKPFKKRLRSRITECIKENGWLNFGTSASQDSEKVVQAQTQSLRTATSGHRMGAGRASLNSDWGPPSQCQPSDALTLLADLALGGSGDETIEKLTPVLGTKLSGRGRRHPHRRKLPPKSSESEGLVVSGELVLVISKEHSYSLPPSCLLLGLSGEPLQVSPPDSTETSLPSGQQGPPQHADKDDAAPLCPEERSREEVTSLPPGSAPPKHSVSVRHKRGRSWFRRVVQAGETIRVTRLWKEKYEFNHDSKYTNDPLDKTVIRALHGPWDFRIEETIDQARLILHMWIGLFYSRSTTRFFQTDPNGPVLEGPPPAERLQEESQVKTGAQGVTPDALPGSEIGRDPSEMQHHAPPAFTPPPESEALDLREESKKKAEPLLPAPKVLDLSQKRSEVLDLSVTSKPVREACPSTSSHTDLAKTPPPHSIHKPTPRRYNWTMYSYYPSKDTYFHFNNQYRASADIPDETSEQGDDNNDSCLEDDNDRYNLTCSDTTEPVENDAIYAQLCERIASVRISRGKLFNGTHRATFDCLTAQFLDRERDETGGRRERTLYVQPCRLTDVNCTAAEAPEPAGASESTSIKGTITTAEGEQGLCGEGKVSLTMHNEKDLSEDEEHTAAQTVNDISTGKHREVPDGNGSFKFNVHTAVNDGNGFNNGEKHTSVCENDTGEGEENRAVPSEIAVSAGEEHPGVQDGVDFHKGGEHIVDEGKGFSEGEEHTEMHHGTDYYKGGEHTVVHDRNEFRKDEERTAMHHGSDCYKGGEHTVVCDGNDFGQGEEHTTTHGGIDSNKGEEDRALHDLDELHDGNSFGQEEAPTQGNDSSQVHDLDTRPFDNRSPTPTLDELSCDRILDSSEREIHTALYDANTFHRVFEPAENTSQSSTPTQDEIPCSQSPDHDDSRSLPDGLLHNEVDPNSEVLCAPEMQQSDPDPCLSNTHLCTQEEPHVMDSPISCSSTTLNQSLSENSFELHSSSNNETLDSATAPAEVPVCRDHELLPTVPQVDGPSPNHTCSSDYDSITDSKEDSVLQEPTCSDSLYRDHKSNNHSKPTGNIQNPSPNDYEPCSNSYHEPEHNSIASIVDPQYGDHESIPASADNLHSDQKPALNGVHAAKLDTESCQQPSSPKHNTTEFSLSGTTSKNVSSGEMPQQGQDSSCDPAEDLWQCHHRPSSGSNDRNIEDMQDTDYAAVPNHRHWRLSSELCKTVIPPKSNYNFRNDLKTLWSDGKDKSAENVCHSSSETFSKNKHSPTQSSPAGLCSDSSYASVQDSLQRTPEPLDACSQRGSVQHGFRDHRSCSSHSSAHDPPAHRSRKPSPSSKQPIMALRPCKSEVPEGDGVSVLLEADKMKSPDSVEGSYDAAAKYAGRLRKRRHQQEEEYEEEEYGMRIYRESVSSGSLSAEINGDEAAGSPTADNVSGSDSSRQWNDQEADDVLGHTTTQPCTGFPYQSKDEWDNHEMVEALDYSKTRPMSLNSNESEGLGMNRVSFLGHRTESSAKETDWLSYRRSRKREGSSQSWVCKKEGKSDSTAMTPSIITVLDHRGNRKTYENYPIVKTVSSEHTRTIQNSSKGSGHFYSFFQRWDELHHSKPDLTQSSLDLEYLIFSEKMSQMLKKDQRISSCSSSTRYPWRKRTASDADSAPCDSPMRVQFSGLKDCISEGPHDAPMSLIKRKIKVDMPERAGLRVPKPNDCSSSAASETPLRLRLPYANGVVEPCPAVSNIVAECTRTYHGMMNDVCSGTKLQREPERFKKERSSEWHSADFCSQTEDMTITLHDDLNTIVRQSFKVKFRFYILVTSADAFFEQTKEELEAEGHVCVEPEQFDLGGRSCHTPLLIILRNEDIAEHVSEIPHLLELKKTPSVLFAGVDRPDDVLNLTHQELFSRGGFVVCDRVALDTLSLDNIKTLVGFLDDLSKKGKWKWFLHYKDSRQLRERARSSSDARELKQFVDYCQEAGLVEVLPYHECDIMSQDRPDYLHCLLRLQVQNAIARFPVFITDTPEDSFGKCGIFAMNINTFLRISKSDTCTIL